MKWQIEDAAEKARWADQTGEAAWARDGWRGGACDPAEVCDFAAEGADAA